LCRLRKEILNVARLGDLKVRLSELGRRATDVRSSSGESASLGFSGHPVEPPLRQRSEVGNHAVPYYVEGYWLTTLGPLHARLRILEHI
jgi:hypothetical protein